MREQLAHAQYFASDEIVQLASEKAAQIFVNEKVVRVLASKSREMIPQQRRLIFAQRLGEPRLHFRRQLRAVAFEHALLGVIVQLVLRLLRFSFAVGVFLSLTERAIFKEDRQRVRRLVPAQR